MPSLLYDSQPEQTVEAAQESAIRSHQSFEDAVEGVCHHSGRYLTRAESIPDPLTFLREQHDFPGFRELDRKFYRAVHSREHLHSEWSMPVIQALALFLAGGLLFRTTLQLATRQDQIATPLDFVLFYVLTTLGSLAGLGCVLMGIWLIRQRDHIYHQRATGQPPAIADFPLFCTYRIEAHEQLTTTLRNDQPQQAAPISQHCTLTIALYPNPNTLHDYQTYQQLYQQHNVGTYMHAGMLALERHHRVDFGTALEFGHRYVLRLPVPETLRQGSSTTGPLATITTPYTIRTPALYCSYGDQRRFLLECRPELQPHDSYTLNLQFHWLGDPDLKCVLEECRLRVPPELRPATRVSFGRYDTQSCEVIWRNLLFHNHTLTVSVTFSQPLLTYSQLITGVYACRLSGLASELLITPDHIWNVLGRRAIEDTTPIIHCSSQIRGDLAIDPRRLSQEHEHVSIAHIDCLYAPDYELIEEIITVLANHDVNILRIGQPSPRLDPGGTVEKQFYYWDIQGRHYELDMLDAVDVHLIVAGYSAKAGSNGAAQQSRLDLRVRCVHDPRNTTRPQRAQYLCEALESDLQQKLGVPPVLERHVSQ